MSDPAPAPARVAYLVNRHPAVSHSFIRREIAALEAMGIAVDRYAIRGREDPLADPRDIAEIDRTRYTMDAGLPGLLRAAMGQLAARPGPFFAALRTALAMSRGSVRPLPYHLVWLGHACRIRAWLEETPAAHLHAHFGTNSAEIALLVKRLEGPAYSFTVHGQDEIEQAKRLHFRDKVAEAAFVAAVSQHGRAQLLREIDTADWDKVQVVHCGLDADFLDADPAPLPDAPRCLTIARLSEEKGHLVLLPAFARLRETHPGATLTLAGDGPMRAEIEAEITRLGLDDAVRITGWVSSDVVREEIARARLVVQPSFIEGLPVVLMEAMAMGRPVISTFVGGVPELVRPGENGWLVPAGDVDALARALDTALSLPEDRLAEIGAAGRAAAREGHDASREAAKLARLFTEGTRPCAD